MLSLLTTVWQVQKAPYPTILEWTHVFTTMVFIIYCISKHVAPAVHLVYYIKQRQRNPTGQYRMHNPKKLATLGTQDRRGNTEYTTQKHKTQDKINTRVNRRDNQEWTTQRHWQHRIHKTQDKINTRVNRRNNTETLTTSDTQDKITTRVNRRNNTETLTTSDTQDTGQNKH